MKDAHEQSKAYVQLILGVGYLALFASWSFAEPFLSVRERAWSGLLAGVSVTSFILVEVLNIFIVGLMGLAPALPTLRSKMPAALVRIGIAITKPTIGGYIGFWLLAWSISTISGAGSAAVILRAFYRNLSGNL